MEVLHEARASPPVIIATLDSPSETERAASSNRRAGLWPPCVLDLLFRGLTFSCSARSPGRSGYGHVQHRTVNMLVMLERSFCAECCESPMSSMALWIASTINCIGSRASWSSRDRLTTSATPTTMGMVMPKNYSLKVRPGNRGEAAASLKIVKSLLRCQASFYSGTKPSPEGASQAENMRQPKACGSID